MCDCFRAIENDCYSNKMRICYRPVGGSDFEIECDDKSRQCIRSIWHIAGDRKRWNRHAIDFAITSTNGLITRVDERRPQGSIYVLLFNTNWRRLRGNCKSQAFLILTSKWSRSLFIFRSVSLNRHTHGNRIRTYFYLKLKPKITWA